MKEVRDSTASILDGTTLADILERSQRVDSEAVMYISRWFPRLRVNDGPKSKTN